MKWTDAQKLNLARRKQKAQREKINEQEAIVSRLKKDLRDLEEKLCEEEEKAGDYLSLKQVNNSLRDKNQTLKESIKEAKREKEAAEEVAEATLAMLNSQSDLAQELKEYKDHAALIKQELEECKQLLFETEEARDSALDKLVKLRRELSGAEEDNQGLNEKCLDHERAREMVCSMLDVLIEGQHQIKFAEETGERVESITELGRQLRTVKARAEYNPRPLNRIRERVI